MRTIVPVRLNGRASKAVTMALAAYYAHGGRGGLRSLTIPRGDYLELVAERDGYRAMAGGPFDMRCAGELCAMVLEEIPESIEFVGPAGYCTIRAEERAGGASG